MTPHGPPHGPRRYLSTPDGHAWKVIDRQTGGVLIFADQA